MLSSKFAEHAKQLVKEGLHRKRRLLDSEVRLNFSSNDYLSLTEEPELKRAYQQGLAHYPAGSGGSMIVCGYYPIHKELERAFCQALDADDALLFNSGYAANLAIISLLSRFNGNILIDKSAHASFYDGLSLAKATYSRFLHNDFANLELKLQARPENPVIITEAVFSMSGQAANLRQLNALSVTYQADCIIDEAHAFGVFGREGLGAVVQYGLSQQDIPLRVIPLGKAYAAQGAMVVGRGEWIDALLQTARSYIYSTAISPALAYGLLATLDFIRKAEERRQKLFELIAYFQECIKKSPLRWAKSQTPIQQLQLGCPRRALAYVEALYQRGIFCQAMREPSVTKKHTGLRVVLSYQHNCEDLAYLFSQLEQIYEAIP